MTYAELVTRLRKRAKELPERFSKNEENIRLFLAAADTIESTSKAYENLFCEDLEDLEVLCCSCHARERMTRFIQARRWEYG